MTVTMTMTVTEKQGTYKFGPYIINTNYVFSYNLNLSDTNDLQSEFGLLMEDVWYFAPRLQEFWPYDVVICLIWTSPFTGARNPDWSDDVSKPKFKKFKIQILIS